MRKYLLLFVPLAAFLAIAQQDVPKPAPPKLTPEQLKEMIDSGKKFFFLDVREPKELEELGTLAGYVNIPLGQVEARLAEIPKDVPIVTACNGARRAATAAETLIKNGYTDISLAAMLEYKEKGFPLVYPTTAEAKEENK